MTDEEYLLDAHEKCEMDCCQRVIRVVKNHIQLRSDYDKLKGLVKDYLVGAGMDANNIDKYHERAQALATAINWTPQVKEGDEVETILRKFHNEHHQTIIEYTKNLPAFRELAEMAVKQLKQPK